MMKPVNVNKSVVMLLVFILAFQIPAQADTSTPGRTNVRIAIVDTHDGYAMINAASAIRKAGGTPVKIKTLAGSIESLNLDGLFLPGGPDVCPLTSYFFNPHTFRPLIFGL